MLLFDIPCVMHGITINGSAFQQKTIYIEQLFNETGCHDRK